MRHNLYGEDFFMNKKGLVLFIFIISMLTYAFEADPPTV